LAIGLYNSLYYRTSRDEVGDLSLLLLLVANTRLFTGLSRVSSEGRNASC